MVGAVLAMIVGFVAIRYLALYWIFVLLAIVGIIALITFGVIEYP